MARKKGTTHTHTYIQTNATVRPKNQSRQAAEAAPTEGTQWEPAQCPVKPPLISVFNTRILLHALRIVLEVETATKLAIHCRDPGDLLNKRHEAKPLPNC